jgi:hypothetical protein
VNLRAGLHDLEKRKFLTLPGLELDPSVAQNKRTSMSLVGFEPTIPVFERVKTAHALDCATTVIGRMLKMLTNYSRGSTELIPA